MNAHPLNKPATRLTAALLASLALLFLAAAPASAVRIKDMAAIKGIRENQLVGYGLVVGLNGTGDKSGSRFTIQAMVNMLERMGVRVEPSQISIKNVAAVVVTARLPAFARIGSKLDVVISSLGDAQSLVGGTLLLTPLKGVDGRIYALAQGPLAVGGAGAQGEGAGAVKNHLLAARIARGASVERELPMTLNGRDHLTLTLFNPDFTTAARLSRAVNEALGGSFSAPEDSGTITVSVPEPYRGNVALFIADIESVEVSPDTRARIVVNEKTGTVVIGENVRISTVAVSHGNLSITVTERPEVVQPQALGEGETVTTPRTDIEIREQQAKVLVVPSGSTIGELVRALNAIGVTPRDLISIFQSIKAAGALQADLQII